MKKKKSFRLPVMLNKELSEIRGGSVATQSVSSGMCCDCTCTLTTNNGCANGPGTLKAN